MYVLFDTVKVKLSNISSEEERTKRLTVTVRSNGRANAKRKVENSRRIFSTRGFSPSSYASLQLSDPPKKLVFEKCVPAPAELKWQLMDIKEQECGLLFCVEFQVSTFFSWCVSFRKNNVVNIVLIEVHSEFTIQEQRAL